MLRNAIRTLLALAACLVFAIPAYAADSSVSLSEPGTLTLLSVAFAGVLIGRRLSRKPPRD